MNEQSTRKKAGVARPYRALPPAPYYFLACLRRRSQHYGCLGRQQQEGKGLLQVEADYFIGVVEIANRGILADVQFEVAAAGAQHHRARNRIEQLSSQLVSEIGPT